MNVITKATFFLLFKSIRGRRSRKRKLICAPIIFHFSEILDFWGVKFILACNLKI